MTALEGGAFLFRAAAIRVVAAVEVFLVVAVIGARRQAEAQVGVIGALAAFLSIMPPELGWRLEDSDHPLWSAVLGAILPDSLAVSWGTGPSRVITAISI